MSATRAGFIGLGRMGRGMAPRLLEAGYALSVYDVEPAACTAVVARGATLCASPAELARRCDVILSCVPGPAEVGDVWEGPQGVIGAARTGTLLVEMSTIGPAQSRRLEERAAAAGLAYLDAPVSNSVGAAARGELTIMVGGAQAHYERALPVLRHLGNRIYHMGGTGAGNVAKTLNQMIYLGYVAAFCEAARLGHEASLDLNQLVDVLRNSVAGTPLMTGWEKRLESGERHTGFRIRGVLKDLSLGAEVCAGADFHAPMFQAALRAYRKAGEAGCAEQDMTSIYDTTAIYSRDA